MNELKTRTVDWSCRTCKHTVPQYQFNLHWKCSRCDAFYPNYDHVKLCDWNCTNCKCCAEQYRVENGYNCSLCHKFYPDLLGTTFRKFLFGLFILIFIFAFLLNLLKIGEIHGSY